MSGWPGICDVVDVRLHAADAIVFLDFSPFRWPGEHPPVTRSRRLRKRHLLYRGEPSMRRRRHGLPRSGVSPAAARPSTSRVPMYRSWTLPAATPAGRRPTTTPAIPSSIPGSPPSWSILDAVAPGAALDAACGTGRHARRLAGTRFITSPGWTRRRRCWPGPGRRCPRPPSVTGTSGGLPPEPASVDLVVCALALEHVADLGAAIAELSRVLRPGGHMVLSGLHPAAAALGGAAYFQDAAGGAGVVQGYGHLHGGLPQRISTQSQLVIRQCLEPRTGPAEAAMQGPAAIHPRRAPRTGGARE